MAEGIHLPSDIGSVIHPETKRIINYHLQAGALSWAQEVGSSKPIQISAALRQEIEVDIKKRGLRPDAEVKGDAEPKAERSPLEPFVRRRPELRPCGHPLGDTRWCPDCEWDEMQKRKRGE